MNDVAHKLKDASAYIGASKIHYACYYINYSYLTENYAAMVEYYPLLAEACIEYKRFSRKFLAAKQGKSALIFRKFIFTCRIYTRGDSR